MLRTQAEAQAPAKDVAGKHIGKWGLPYVTLIVLVGVAASIILDEAKIAAVVGLLSAALTGLIAMLAGVAEAEQKGEAPELDIMKRLIEKLDEPLVVEVSGDKVIVARGKNVSATVDRRRDDDG
jgi:hypothetical protein